MKFRPARAAVALIGTSLLLLAGIRSAQAAEIKIVSPSAYKDREGEGCFCSDSEPPYRYQQVFPAADFAALGNQPHWIVGFGPRADQSVTSPSTAFLPDNYVRLSTTQQGPGHLSSVFDDNFGSDVIQFYSGPLTMVADVAGPGPGPREFYHADFPAGVAPFLYDPSQGNLLFDFIAWQGESPKILADQIRGLQTVVADPFATQGDRGAAAIFQFTFVPVGVLQAGDADMDLDFDQRDLVQVQIAAKYLTGQAATWGQGDWNAAPGGSPGNPPQGNGLFDQLDIIAALGPGHYLTGPYAAIGHGGTEGDGQTSIVYDAATGELGVDAPAGSELTSINIDSAAAIFTGNPAMNLGGSFDNDADGNIFKATFGSSFGSLSFGNVAQAGLSEEFVLNDLTVIGSLAGGGDLGNVDLIYVPEPSAMTLVVFAMLSVALYAVRRRK